MKDFDIEKVRQNLDKAQKGELVCTEDGHCVRLFCLDAKGEYPLIGIIDHEDYESPINWTIDGKFVKGSVHHEFDLKLKSTKIKGWVNVYDIGNRRVLGAIWESKERAEGALDGGEEYVRTMYVEYNEF